MKASRPVACGYMYMISPKTVTGYTTPFCKKRPAIRQNEERPQPKPETKNQKQPPAPVLKPPSHNRSHPENSKTSPRPFVNITGHRTVYPIPKPKPIRIVRGTTQTLTSPGSSMTPSIQPLPAGMTAPEIPLSSIAIPSPSPRSTYF